MFSVDRVREFLLASYHDLPNILFVGSLLIGALMGYLPLLWMAVGLILNALVIQTVQKLFGFLINPSNPWEQIAQASGSPACMIGLSRFYSSSDKGKLPSTMTGTRIVAPSHWIGASTFFAAFSIYNSIRVAMRPASEGADPEKTDTRRAFSFSALLVGIVFLGLVMARAFTGCETFLGGSLGMLLGISGAIGFWHLLNLCGTGKIPDILQVVGSMAPEGAGAEVPVMCVAPPIQESAEEMVKKADKSMYPSM
jgi:hypothetical protein